MSNEGWLLGAPGVSAAPMPRAGGRAELPECQWFSTVSEDWLLSQAPPSKTIIPLKMA